MKYSLDISNILEMISSLPHSIFSLYFFALFTYKNFLLSPCYSLEICIQPVEQMEASSVFGGSWVIHCQPLLSTWRGS